MTLDRIKITASMPAESYEQLLNRAAESSGIELGYWDIWGHYHEATADTKRALLSSMGIDASSPEALERAMAARTHAEWNRLVAPTVVAKESAAASLDLQVPAEWLGEPASITVKREDGQTFEFQPHLWELPQIASMEMDGRTWMRKRASLPVALPLGYHEIAVRVAGVTATTRYIVTPERAWSEPHLGRRGRTAGVAISLYGVRSNRNWGCGDFRDLLDVIEWVVDELEAGFVSLNPLHAIHNRRPFNNSPYLPNCTFYQNFLYLDVEGIEDFGSSRRARACFDLPEVQQEIRELRSTPFVEYERVSALKLRFLKIIFAGFLRNEWRRSTERARQFQAFLDREGVLLERFATHCALDEIIHQRDPNVWLWTDWPEPYRNPDSVETREFRRKHWRRVLFHQYLQWQIDRQLRRAQERARNRRMPIGLYHDLALATDRFGSDLWAHRPFYVSGCRVGSPPDDFSPEGQDWAFPPPNSRTHREDGYRLFAESIRKNCRHGGALRIDHVMRLFRLYWIPDDLGAANGAYVRERNDDFVRILALESVRNQVVIVGEDLGTVEPEVREALSRFGILSYRLLYFEKNKDGQFRGIDEYPAQALVSSTTHDLPTLAGYWVSADIEARHNAGVIDEATYKAQIEQRQADRQKMLDVLFAHRLMPADLPRSAAAYPELTGELHNAVVGFLAMTPSQLLAINQEDLTKEMSQQNLPGTTWQYPNWSRKMRFTVEELRSHPEARGFTAMFRNWIENSGRRNGLGE